MKKYYLNKKIEIITTQYNIFLIDSLQVGIKKNEYIEQKITIPAFFRS